MNIKGLNDRQIAELVVSTIIGSIAEDGYTAEKIKEELTNNNPYNIKYIFPKQGERIIL